MTKIETKLPGGNLEGATAKGTLLAEARAGSPVAQSDIIMSAAYMQRCRTMVALHPALLCAVRLSFSEETASATAAAGQGGYSIVVVPEWRGARC